MVKSFTATDLRPYEILLTLDAQGNVAGQRVAYYYVDENGQDILEMGNKVMEERFDGSETFSELLELSDQQLPGKANQNVKVARDKVKEHVRDFAAWAKARAKQKEGF